MDDEARGMKLNQLDRTSRRGGDALVSGFAIDHRKVAPGTIFGAFQGARVNGEDFIADAVRQRRGGGRRPAGRAGGGRSHRLGRAARALPGWRRRSSPFPATAVAVTGTNGKTSTVEMTRQLWRMAGHPPPRSALGVTTPTSGPIPA
jgi:UDP-N-acetylmuramoyl-L-alanyl-D-glutamate--2,6-diaminopimelate ligase